MMVVRMVAAAVGVVALALTIAVVATVPFFPAFLAATGAGIFVALAGLLVAVGCPSF